jgi:hypothetical protein
MSIETYEKLDIACKQLDTAIDLFFQGENHFSVITLAGAAEEILGRYMELVGKQSSLEGIVEGTALVHKHLYGVDLPHREFKFRANMARNSIKHLDSDEDLNVTFDSEQEMIDMLVRATDNYYGLEIPESDQVQKFNQWYMKNVVGV